MTTEDRAYEAAARAMANLAGHELDTFPENLRDEVIAQAKVIVTAFLTAMGQEVQ